MNAPLESGFSLDALKSMERLKAHAPGFPLFKTDTIMLQCPFAMLTRWNGYLVYFVSHAIGQWISSATVQQRFPATELS